MSHSRLITAPPGLLALSLLAAALVGILRLELHDGSGLRKGALKDASAPTQPVRQHPKRAVVSAAQDRPNSQDDQYVTTILARPLFSPNRRPPPVAAASNHDTATELARLTGVIISPDGKRAIFAGSAVGKPVVVGEGTHIGPYVVRSISIGAVTVSWPEGQRVLHPAFDPNLPQRIESEQPSTAHNQPQKPGIPAELLTQFQQALRDSQQYRNQSPR